MHARQETMRERRLRLAGQRPTGQGDLRARNEDDDGYDPYCDYMDQLARRSAEEPCEDPWR